MAWRLVVAIAALVVIFVVLPVVAIYKIDRACGDAGGVLVRGDYGYSCIEAVKK